MTTTLIETPREFNVLKDGDLLVLPVRHLTLKQINKVGDMVADKIRTERRKEFISVSELLPSKERNQFLMDAARYNLKIDPEESAAVADSVFGVICVLSLATDLTADELTELVAVPENETELDFARYHALGLDIDSLRAAIEADMNGETKTGATFPQEGQG